MGLKEDRLRRIREKWVLCPICGSSSRSFVVRGLSDNTLVCGSCRNEWAMRFSGSPHWEDEPVWAKLKYSRKSIWLSMEGWITREMREYERSQKARGYDMFEGEWITQEEKRRRELERKQRAEELRQDWLKRILEFERREWESLKGSSIKLEWVDCPRCGYRYDSKLAECPMCKARRIREAQDRSRLY